jgi:hypothetical protein
MHRVLFFLAIAASLACLPAIVIASPEKEFLTDKEIALLQENQQIASRVKLYLNAAALRLKCAEDRLSGKESEEGDPLEFWTPEDMLEAYSRILDSTMYHLEDAYQNPRLNPEIGSALKSLRKATEEAGKELEILKKIAEDQKKERLWNLVNQAIENTNDAHQGAEQGLSKNPPPPEKMKKSGK